MGRRRPEPRVIGVRSRSRGTRPANPITLCDGHDAGLVTVTGQVLLVGQCISRASAMQCACELQRTTRLASRELANPEDDLGYIQI